MFKDCCSQALTRVQEQVILECIGDKDEILFIFDGLIVDYALLKYNIHGDEFKSLLSKHDVLNDGNVKSYLDTVVNKLHELNERY